MKKILLSLCVAIVALSFVTEDANAWRLFRRRTTTTSNSSSNSNWSISINASDQAKCEYKARRMAAAGRMSHSFGPLAGTFEGVGYSSGPNPGTCTPRRGMRLTGDSIVRGNNGMYYRCRSWR